MNNQCFYLRPYSDWHGHNFYIEYCPDYGVIAPQCTTTNGNPYAIMRFIDDTDVLIEFVKWVHLLGWDWIRY